MAKKRTSLDSLFGQSEETNDAAREVAAAPPVDSSNSSRAKAAERAKVGDRLSRIINPPVEATVPLQVDEKPDIIKQTVYLPAAVHEQLRQLAFEERRKMHDYLVEGLDRVFKNRGLKPYGELSKNEK